MSDNVLENVLDDLKPKKKRWLKVLVIVLVVIFSLALLSFGFLFGYYKYYQNKIYPGVYVGEYHLGGMTEKEIQNFVETLNNKLSKEGIDLIVKDNGNVESVNISNVVMVGDNATELVVLDSAKLLDIAREIGRNGNWFNDLWLPIHARIYSSHLEAPVILDKEKFVEILKENISSFEEGAREADIKITEYSTFTYEVIEEKSGKIFDYDKVLEGIIKNLSTFSFTQTVIEPNYFSPTIFAKELEGLEDNLKTVFDYGSLGLNFVDPHSKFRRDWTIEKNGLMDFVKVYKNEEGEIVFGLDEEKVGEYLDENVKLRVDKIVQNAKFEMSDGKVRGFQGSSPGVEFNKEQTFADLNEAFKERNYHAEDVVKTVSVAFDVIEPTVKVSDINDLGIEGIVGVGVSTFRDSHNNRIKNIAHAVELLNGVLIKPDEEFSTIGYAGPFTLANGYLPEEVIKGDEIKKEVGGGMCQIGTTLFRMAMNSGMPITERRNHSLVVSYYADPVNGNPGTDATVYEPILDLKFLNDTGSHMLLQTDIDYQRQELTFTLWGKLDGRKGWYTHPVVERWIPAGEEQIVETEALEPGVKKCQSAFTGAVTNFTYSRVTPEGEKIDRVFESYYRPLQRICMVGKEPVPECEKTMDCESEETTVEDVPVEGSEEKEEVEN